jgi:protease PrsW
MNPFAHLLIAGFFSVVPMIFYLFVIWFLDRNDREPIWIVLLCFVWGATGAVIFAIIGSIIMGLGVSEFIYIFANKSDAGTLNNLAGAVIVAPIVEESTKGIFLLLVALSRNFDGPVDGFVYGGAIGLGFGMSENFLYFLSFPTNYASLFILIIIRTLFSAVLHCCTQATLGAVIGYVKFKGMLPKLLLVPVGLGIAMFIHFTWNLTVSFNSTAILGFLFMMMTVVVILSVYQIGLYNEHKMILRELTDEAEKGLLPREHVKYIPYYLRRNKKGWLPNTINQKDYVKTAIKLALRKYQSKGSKSNTYPREVETLRTKIKVLLSPLSV